MIRKKILPAIAGIAIMLCLPAGNAAIIDNGNFTSDTRSGLDWLDVSLSRGESYLDVRSGFGEGGKYKGWRYATLDEFLYFSESLLGVDDTTFNFLDITGNYTGFYNNDTIIDSAISLLGDTLNDFYLEKYGMGIDQYEGYVPNSSTAIHISQGMLFESRVNDSMVAGFTDQNEVASNSGDSRDYVFIHSRYNCYDTRDAQNVNCKSTGSWLVSDSNVVDKAFAAVPEPSILALMSLGLAGLGFFRRRLIEV